MSIKRVGQFIEFTVAGEGGGTRSLARMTSVQLLSEVDCTGSEAHLTVANRSLHVLEPYDEIRAILLKDNPRRRV